MSEVYCNNCLAQGTLDCFRDIPNWVCTNCGKITKPVGEIQMLNLRAVYYKKWLNQECAGGVPLVGAYSSRAGRILLRLKVFCIEEDYQGTRSQILREFRVAGNYTITRTRRRYLYDTDTGKQWTAWDTQYYNKNYILDSSNEVNIRVEQSYKRLVKLEVGAVDTDTLVRN